MTKKSISKSVRRPKNNGSSLITKRDAGVAILTAVGLIIAQLISNYISAEKYPEVIADKIEIVNDSLEITLYNNAESRYASNIGIKAIEKDKTFIVSKYTQPILKAGGTSKIIIPLRRVSVQVTAKPSYSDKESKCPSDLDIKLNETGYPYTELNFSIYCDGCPTGNIYVVRQASSHELNFQCKICPGDPNSGECIANADKYEWIEL